MLSVLMFDLPRICITAILLISLFSRKSVQIPDRSIDSSSVYLMSRFIEYAHLPFTLALSYLIYGSNSVNGALLGTAILIAMMAIGFILKKRKILETCNCYGSLARHNSFGAVILNYILLFCSGIIFYSYMLNENTLIHVYSERSVASFIVVIFCSVIVGSWIEAKKNMANQKEQKVTTENNPSHKISFSADLLIGNAVNGEKIFLERIAATAPLILFVGLSNNCPACNHAKPLLSILADTFQTNLKTIFVYDGAPSSESKSDMSNLIYGSTEFFSAVNNDSYPFCVAINTHDLTQIGEISYSASSIWETFYRVLSVTIKK